MPRLLVIVLVIMLALVGFYFTASAASAEVVEGYTATLSYASSNASVYAKYAADNYLRTITTPDEHASELTDIELYALAKQYGVTLPRDLSEKRKAVLKAAFSDWQCSYSLRLPHRPWTDADRWRREERLQRDVPFDCT